MLYSHKSRRSLSSGLPFRYVTRAPSGEIFRPTMVGPANGGASDHRSMVSSAALAPVATAQATNAGARYLPEFRESVMNFSLSVMLIFSRRGVSRGESVLQPGHPIANLAQFSQPARLEPRLKIQYIVPG